MGAFVELLGKAEVEEGFDASSASDSVNEYFRKNFRKMNVAQASDILAHMNNDNAIENGITCLDGKFWVWETLEEAIRGDVD